MDHYKTPYWEIYLALNGKTPDCFVGCYRYPNDVMVEQMTAIWWMVFIVGFVVLFWRPRRKRVKAFRIEDDLFIVPTELSCELPA